MQNDLCYRKSNEIRTKWGHVGAGREPKEREEGRKVRRGKEGAEESRREEINTDSEGVR